MHTVYMLRSYTDPQWQGAPAPVDDYQAFGFHRQGGQVWSRHWIPAPMAKRYAELGLSPSDAKAWGVIPALVEAYQAAGIHVLTVGEWVARGIMPDHARFLIQSGAITFSPNGYLPPGAHDKAVDYSEEYYSKWHDDFDQSWHDADWPEPEESYDPIEQAYTVDDDRHPDSPYDPFDANTVDDPYAAGDFVDDLEREAPEDSESLWNLSVANPPSGGQTSASSTSLNNVVPLFPSRRDEDRTS